MAEAVAVLSSLIVAAIPSSGAAAFTIGATSVSYATIAATVAVTAASVAASAALAPSAPSLSPSAQKQNFRQAVTPRRRFYGRVKVGGPIAFLEVRTAANLNKPGTDGHLFSLVLLAAHEIDGIEEYWLADALVTLSGGLVNEAPFYLEGWRRAKLVAQLGTDDQVSHPTLTAVFPEWTANHRCRGIANILGQFGSLEDKAFNKTFPNGVPIMRVLMRSSKVWDPRGIEWFNDTGTGAGELMMVL